MRYLRVGMIFTLALLVAVLFLAGPASEDSEAAASVSLKPQTYLAINDTSVKNKPVLWQVSGIPVDGDGDPGMYNYTVYYREYNRTGSIIVDWTSVKSSTIEGRVEVDTWDTTFFADSWYYALRVMIYNWTNDLYANVTTGYFPIENSASDEPEGDILNIINPDGTDILTEPLLTDRTVWWNTTVNWSMSDDDFGEDISCNLMLAAKGTNGIWEAYTNLTSFGTPTATMSFSSSFAAGSFIWNVSAYAPGTYRIMLKVTDGAGHIKQIESEEFNIDGSQAPVVQVSQSPSIVYVGDNVTFTVTAYDPNAFGAIVSYKYNPGVDGVLLTWTTSNSYTYRYMETGTYDLIVTVLDNDAVNTKFPVQVDVNNIKPSVAYSYLFDPAEGNKTFSEATFTSLSTDLHGSVNYTSWYFNDPHSEPVENFQIGEEVTHTFIRPGTYSVKLTVRDDEGMYNETTFQVQVSNRPPDVSITYTSTAHRNDTLDFISNAEDQDGEIVTTLWTIDGNATSNEEEISYKFTEMKQYTVNISAYDGAEYTNKTYTVDIINLLPTITMWADGPSYEEDNETVWVATLGEPLIISPRYMDTDGTIANVIWSINATGAVYEYKNGNDTLDITFNTHGTYLFTIVVYDDSGDMAETTFPIFVNRKPISEISSLVSADIMEFVKFDPSNSSDPDGPDDIVKYFWHFGDGSYATLDYNANASNIAEKYAWDHTDVTGTIPSGYEIFHLYGKPLLYQIFLTVTDRFGATNTSAWPILIPTDSLKVTTISWYVPLPAGATDTPHVFSGDDVGEASITNDIYFNVTLLENITGTIGYKWNFGDNSIGMGNNITHVFTQTGTLTVQLTVYVDGEPKYFDHITVTIHDVPKIIINYKPYWKVYLSAGFDASATIKDEGNIIVKYIWDFGDGSASIETTNPEVSHIYTENGTYLVQLTVIDGRGAIASKRVPITIKNRTDSILESPDFTSTTTILALVAVSMLLVKKRQK